MIPLAKPIRDLISYLDENGVRPVLVGGFVRDHLSGHDTLDMDIELYGLSSPEMIETLLSPLGNVNTVGKSFGVIKFTYEGYQIDFSPPRLESKNGTGHKGFDVVCAEGIDFATAARRRDFTINAIGYDPVQNVFLDPYGGIGDLKAKRLACVDPATFVEDPLRVLRAVQFAARFELSCDPSLLTLCKTMITEGALEELPRERLFEEFKKLFLLADRPSIGLSLLKEMGALPFFSPLERFESTPQDPLSHPEGDVWTHTLMCIDTMADKRTGDPKQDIVLMFAALLHDIGKPDTTVIENGKLNAPKHAEIGVPIARAWLEKITEERYLIDSVLPLVKYHGWPRKLYKNASNDSEIMNLSRHVCIDQLIRVADADFFGRTFIENTPETFEAGEWLYERAKALGVLFQPPTPLLMGRDLIAQGLVPSERFKTILDKAYEAQINREFFTHEQAKEWLQNYLVTML